MILGLATQPSSPGQRFRVHSWARRLRADGVRYREVAFATMGLSRALTTRAGAPRLAQHGLGALASYPFRLGLGAFDALFVYREAAPVGPPVVEAVLKGIGRRPLAYDIDDPIFLPPEGSPAPWLQGLRSARKWQRLCALADVTLCINEPIADRVRAFARRVEVVPNLIDVPAYAGVRDKRRIPVLGYSGSHSTMSMLRSIERPLAELARSHRFEVHAVGGRADLDIPGTAVRELGWSEEGEREMLLGFDIGLAPAPNTEWNRYKSFVKVLLYMASALPVVASPVGLPAVLIKDGENGFLARRDEDWVHHLATLLGDEDLRRRVGNAARETVEREFGLERHFPRVRTLLLNLVSGVLH